MPRQTRFRIAGATQLVMQRGHNSGSAFRHASDYHMYLDYLNESAQETECAVHAYGLFADHILLLCTPQHADGVSKLMQAVGRRYAYAFNHTYFRTGALWDGRYKACLVEASRYVLASYRFVETQPVRIGCVAETTDYRWSSHHSHVSGEMNRVIEDHWVYLNLAERTKERAKTYRDIFRFPLSEALLADVRHALHHCLVLGSERFKDDVARKLSTRVRLGQPGRPKKRTTLSKFVSSSAIA